MHKREPVSPLLTPGQVAAHLLPMPVDQLLLDKIRSDSEAALAMVNVLGLGSHASCLLAVRRPVTRA